MDMENKQDHPGIYIPPPLFYVIAFIGSLFLQKIVTLNDQFFQTIAASILSILLIIAGVIFLIPALRRFIKSRNTVITAKPANSLQTEGVFAISRNPMYLSLILLYTGISFLIGNWWCIILIPILFLINQEYIIKREVSYLERRFGEEYQDYKSTVRRWL